MSFLDEISKRLGTAQNTLIRTVGDPIRAGIQSAVRTLGPQQLTPTQQTAAATFRARGGGVKSFLDELGSGLSGLQSYVHNNVTTPTRNAATSFRRGDVVGGTLSGLQAAGGALTPGWNMATGAADAGLTAVRQKKPLQEVIARTLQGTQRPGTVSEGLGITNPVLALGTDVLLTRNPKNIVKDPLLLKAGGKALKDAVYPARNLKGLSPRASTIHPDDLAKMDELSSVLRMTEEPVTRGPELEQARQLATHYFGKQWATADARKLTELFDFGIDLNAHLPRGERAPLPSAPSGAMGFVAGASDSPPLGGVRGAPAAAEGAAGTKYAANINKERLNVAPEAKAALDQTVESIRPELEAARGKPLSNQEVLEAAKSAELLKRGVSREQTAKFAASLTALRQEVAAGAEGQGVSPAFVENLRVLSSQAADVGRSLQAFSINADPQLGSVKEQLVRELIALGKNTDDIVRAAQGVDFHDQAQVTKFFRQFVSPKIGEIISEYRYINLLSSPGTHITNAFSNVLQGAVLAPATKLVSGAVDFIGAGLRGKQQQHYVAEVPAYYRGAFSSMGTAVSKAFDALQGKVHLDRPDIDRIPTGSKLVAWGQVVPRALEAGDVFFRTLIAGGEREALALKYRKQGNAVSEAVLDSEALKKASYYVFRSPIDTTGAKTGQGKALQYIDKFTNAVYGLRRVPGVSWFIPFVRTPMNILKQGLEYSPAGVLTLPGAKDPTEQLAKAMIGSTVFAGAAWVAQVGDSTWAAPTNAKDKEAFYASGRQPYSLKIGDQWVSYSRLGPLAYPLAMASALKYYTEQNPKAVTQSKLEQLAGAMGGMAQFFSDQSYVQGIGDLVKALQGDDYYAKRALTNIPTQLIPLDSFLGFVARTIDPVFRKPGTIAEGVKANLPVLSKTVPAYTNPVGDPSVRQHPTFNSLSPIKVQDAVPEFEGYYQDRIDAARGRAELKAQEQALLQGEDENLFGAEAAEESEVNEPLDPREQAKQDLAKQKVKLKGGTVEEGGLVFYRDGKSVKSVPLDRPIPTLALTGNVQYDKRVLADRNQAITAKEGDMVTLVNLGKMTAEQAEAGIRELEAQRASIDKNGQLKQGTGSSSGGTGKKAAQLRKTFVNKARSIQQTAEKGMLARRSTRIQPRRGLTYTAPKRAGRNGASVASKADVDALIKRYSAA